ncbi:MAG: polysaccharide deacetylase family protein [Rhodocyclaceae bacterium]|nr:polysaccharide deacetylase family protein [Rhodocyclaceae bacterium]
MKIALRICAETYRSTREGVPRLVEILQQHKVGATFLFVLGPDQTGRAVRQGFSHQAMRRAEHESAIERYGFPTLLYGTVLPAPDISHRCTSILTETKAAGFETAVHGWNPQQWLGQINSANAIWTATQMQRAHQRYKEIFGDDAGGHGAAKWQMNVHALRLTQRLGYRWASDCRGTHPFVPVWNGEPIHCAQLPTSLPTFDELIGRDGHTAENVHQQLLKMTASTQSTEHVFSLTADFARMKLNSTLNSLLVGWAEQGHEICSLDTLRNSLDFATLPRHELTFRTVAGRAGLLLTQGDEFLSTWKEAA